MHEPDISAIRNAITRVLEDKRAAVKKDNTKSIVPSDDLQFSYSNEVASESNDSFLLNNGSFTGKHLNLTRSNDETSTEEIQKTFDQLKRLTSDMDRILINKTDSKSMKSLKKTRFTPNKQQVPLSKRPSLSDSQPVSHSSSIAASFDASVCPTCSTLQFENNNFKEDIKRLKAKYATALENQSISETKARESKMLNDTTKDELNNLKALVRRMQERVRRNEKSQTDAITKLADELKARDKQIMSLKKQLNETTRRTASRPPGVPMNKIGGMMSRGNSPSGLVLQRKGKDFGRSVIERDEEDISLAELLKGAEDLLAQSRSSIASTVDASNNTKNSIASRNDSEDELGKGEEEAIVTRVRRQRRELNSKIKNEKSHDETIIKNGLGPPSTVAQHTKFTIPIKQSNINSETVDDHQANIGSSTLQNLNSENHFASWDEFAEQVTKLPTSAKELALHAQKLAETTTKQHLGVSINSSSFSNGVHTTIHRIGKDEMNSNSNNHSNSSSNTSNSRFTPSFFGNAMNNDELFIPVKNSISLKNAMVPSPFHASRPDSRSAVSLGSRLEHEPQFSKDLYPGKDNSTEFQKRNSMQQASMVLEQLRGFRKSMEGVVTFQSHD